MDHGHRILELIAEAVRPARLVVAAPRHVAGRYGLIHEPAVEQNIDGRIGRFHLNGVQQLPPLPPCFVVRPEGGVAPAAATDHGFGRFHVGRGPEQKDNDAFFPGAGLEARLQRRAWIKPRSGPAGKRSARQGGRA